MKKAPLAPNVKEVRRGVAKFDYNLPATVERNHISLREGIIGVGSRVTKKYHDVVVAVEGHPSPPRVVSSHRSSRYSHLQHSTRPRD